jgi:SAM-dependent methyltransferase
MYDTDKKKYSADVHIAELYDQHETQTDDVQLICQLIGGRTDLTIFEPFCGTGRIAIPLAQHGHRLICLDEAEGMLQRFRQKLQSQPGDVQNRVEMVHLPVFAHEWPANLDVVLLGGNCFYEVSSSDEQRALVHRAADALAPGGHVFIDHDDHGSDELLPAWGKPPGQARPAFPQGTCQDGTHLEGSTETAWYDVKGRFAHYFRRLKVTHPDGSVSCQEWQETCHPATMANTVSWVHEARLVVEGTFGDKRASPYQTGSSRATVWARKG